MDNNFWHHCLLTDVTQILDNYRRPVNSKERDDRTCGKKISELIPYYGATGQVGYIDDYLTDGEYVILGEDGAPFLDHRKNKAYLINGRSWVNNHAHILKSYFDNKFLLFYLNRIDYTNYVSGTTRLKLTQSALAQIPFLLPPLPEQRAIVAKIELLFSELDNGIACLKKAQEQLKVYRQAVLKQAFEGELTKAWREQQTSLPSAQELLENITNEREQAAKLQGKKLKPVIPLTQAEFDDLPELPNEWKWVKFGDISAVVRGGSPRPAGDPKYYDGDIPFLKVADITKNDSLYINDYEFSIKEAGLKKTRKIHKNTLLLSNSGATLGVPKITQIEATINDGIAAFLDLDSRSLFYAYYFWRSKTTELRRVNQGAAQPNLNTDLIKAVAYPLCGFNEQAQIVQEIETRLSVCDNMETTIKESLEKAGALRQSILKKAFEGKLLSLEELQITRNAPDWEPAEKLLERIRTEKRTTR
jgi:type I restriction enzyme S subunit